MTTCTVCTINLWLCVATMKNRVQLSPPSRLFHTSTCSSRNVFSGAGQREPCLEAFTLRVAPGSLTLWLVHPPDHSLSNALSLLLAVGGGVMGRELSSRTLAPGDARWGGVGPLTCWGTWLQPGWTRVLISVKKCNFWKGITTFVFLCISMVRHCIINLKTWAAAYS